jgi:hypothetical protein
MTAGIVLALAASSAVGSETPAAAGTTGGDKCCFSNPRYSGVCEVTPGEDETCADILAYLNNQASVGKTYCGSTQVRGGWSQVECETSASTTACAAPDSADTRPTS